MAKQQQKGVARRMWRVLRAVLYMLRRGIMPSGRKLAMDLHRGKISGKALGDLLTFHRDAAAGGGFSSSSYAAGAGTFSCRALEDPGLAVHEPSSRARRREVQFSCSNTPSSDLGGRSRRRNDGYLQYHNYDAADVARLFEMLNDDDGPFGDDNHEHTAPAAYALRRIAAESPAASIGSRDGGDAQVDRQADEFIRRFYEQLRAQRSAASTPDYYYAAASPYVSTTPRAIAASIA